MPDSTEKRRTEIVPVLKRYYAAARKYPWLLALVFAGGLVIEGTGVWSSYELKGIIDGVTANAIGAAYIALGLFAIASFAGWFGQRMRQWGLTYVEPKVMSDLSNSSFEHLLRHSHDFFISNFSGTLTRRVTRYARSFENVLDNISFNFFSTGVYVIAILVILTLKNLYLGLGVLAWTAIFIWLQVAMAKWRQPMRIARAEEDSRMTGTISDAIANHSAITLFATEAHEESIFSGAVAKWQAATLRSWIADNWIWAVQGIFVMAVEVGLLGLALYLWQHGKLSVGDIVLIQLYVMGLIGRVWNIGNAMRSLYDAFADAYEMVVILETPHDVADVPTATELAVSEARIDFEHVQFNFNETRVVLPDFDLSIPGGQKVALVGPSGAGKSTVMKILLRLYDVTAGHIRIDGQEIKHVTLESLRRAIAFVPQDPVLFHRSLRENIRYGRLDATDEEVEEAAKKAYCHDFIVSLPEGYDTLVGERGVKLSGGERQRVAIARAILKNAPVLVLDEATSALDSESEHYIQRALATLMKGKTVIVIAHRLSTIMKMDRIVVMEQGRIAAQGTHEELLKQDGLYATLWNIQAGGFLIEEGEADKPREKFVS